MLLACLKSVINILDIVDLTPPSTILIQLWIWIKLISLVSGRWREAERYWKSCPGSSERLKLLLKTQHVISDIFVTPFQSAMLVLTVPGDHPRRVTICYALLISNAGFYRSRQRHVDSKCSGSADMLFVLREKLKLFLQRGIFSGVQGISSTLALLLLMTLLLPTTCICYIQVFVQYETSFMFSLTPP